MTLYHIFYDADKNIAWSSTAGVTEGIIEGEAAEHDYGYAAIECSEIPIGEKFYINDDEDDIVEKTLFEPTFSTTNPEIDEVIEVENVPTGTEVFLDSVSFGTMENTTLTFTATEAGLFTVVLKKDKYYDYRQEIIVKRFGE